MIEGLSTEKCEQRNRIVAQREEVEGAPIRFLAGSADGFATTETAGHLPEDMEGALRLINEGIPENAPRLSADDVYIHYLEAASNNFIGDRFAFLSESTLRNIAEDASRGFAFMNSHRTGSVSQPSELPFGKTFAGQYQAGMDSQGRKRKRAVVGVYMLRGIKPNGENGPTTDDLDLMIRGGQVADVSVGLSKGEKICNVCSGVLSECPHVPGTRRAMTDEQVTAQTANNIPGGKASYTIENARCGEVSAVFDGAVPGAGVKKVMAFKQAGKLNHRELKDARLAFGSLLSGDFSMDTELLDQISDAVAEGVRAGMGGSIEGVEAVTLAPLAPAPDQDELKREQEALRAELDIQAKQLAELLAARPGEPAVKLENNQDGQEGEEEMGTATGTATVPDNALLFAEVNEQMASLKAELQKAKETAAQQAEQIAKLSERNAKLEAEAQEARFTAEVEGAVRGGVCWFGDHDKHKGMLKKLSGAFGEDSAEVKQYIEQNRAFALQLAASDLLKEFGSNGTGDDLSALEELTNAANKLREQNPGMTDAVSFDLAAQRNPEIYERYVTEQRGGRK